jgi:tRNA (guanine26-N2/guanine27-N2)-dimethyltransferase
MRAALLNLGYQFSQAHHEATAVKTDAPPEVVWDIMRVFARDIAPPVGSQNRQPSAVAEKILAKTPAVEVNFVGSAGVM